MLWLLASRSVSVVVQNLVSGRVDALFVSGEHHFRLVALAFGRLVVDDSVY